MAVLSMMKITGDPDELVAKMRETIQPVADQKAPEYGRISATVVKTDDGIMILNMWETEEGRHQMADDADVQLALRGAGLPAPAFKAYEVLEHRTLATIGSQS